MSKLRIEKAIDKIFAGTNTVPGLEELALDLVAQFGGSHSFAKEYHQQYTSAGSGMVKARMLEGILQLIKLTSARKVPTDLGELTTEDLKTSLREMLTRIEDESVEVISAAKEKAEDREPAAGDPATAG